MFAIIVCALLVIAGVAAFAMTRKVKSVKIGGTCVHPSCRSHYASVLHVSGSERPYWYSDYVWRG